MTLLEPRASRSSGSTPAASIPTVIATGEKRLKEPAFYGYLPHRLTRRCFALLTIFLMSTFNLSIRALSFVVLASWGAPALLGVFGFELGLFFAVKAARDDFVHWVPIYGPKGVVASVMARLFGKVTVDWTCCLQFRHPQEVGGLFWSLSLLSTCVIGLSAALFHSDKTVTALVGGSCLGLLGSFGLFLRTIEGEYVATFYDTRTASQYTADDFRNSREDEHKFNVLTKNVKLWSGIRAEVEAWLAESLPVWEEERPPWLTEQKMSLIPKGALGESEGVEADDKAGDDKAARTSQALTIRTS